MVLLPNKMRKQAMTCPSDFVETKGENNWRFCVDPKNPEPIPPLWAPPIAGIPYEEALEIHNRHVEKLSKLPGVESVGLGVNGINIRTTNPSILPSKVEGLAIIPLLPLGPGQLLSHVAHNQIRPLHGAAGLRDNSISGFVTLTGIALANGKPWLIFPAHGLARCMEMSPCPSGSPLSQCAHNTLGQALMLQPISPGAPVVGYVQRWTPLSTTSPQRDVAAAFLENDTIEGNGSLSADRKVEISSIEPRNVAFLGTLPSTYPVPGTNVKMRTSTVGAGGTSHEFSLRIDDVNQVKNDVFASCLPQGTSISLKDQTFYRMLGGFFFIGGDSGSPVFDASENIIGMINGSAPYPYAYLGYGTNVNAIKAELAFDVWYGTRTVQDQTIATFRPSNGQWYVDNGNGLWDGSCNATGGTNVDQCFSYGLGGNVDLPVTGDWDGNGTVTVGVYRTNTSPQQFFLSNNNSTTSYMVNSGPPALGYQPVAGKWAGVNTTTKVGVFRPSTGDWYLDNGDKVINGCPPDTCFNTSSFTLAGDKPLVGDWDNNGSVTIGVFRPSNSTFYLSNNNSTVAYILPAGSPSFGYRPVVGNWTGPNGQTNTKLGVFRPSNGVWYLDNGNRVFAGCAEDQCPAGFGGVGDWPTALDKSIIKAN